MTGRLRPFGCALLLVALLLGLLEGAARLLPLDRLEPQFAGPRTIPLFVPGTGAQAGRMVTNDNFRGILAWQSFARVKPPGAFRVFVLGGSAALGWPYRERNGFTGFLRRALEGVAPAGFEIVSVAGMSYGSHRILDFLREIVERYEPDLVVVWSGNNEYVERNVLPAAPGKDAAGVRVPQALRRSGLYRAVRLALYRAAPGQFAPAGGSDLTDLRAAPVTRGRLGRSPAIDREILGNFRRNLAEEADLLVRQGVPGIFCTVPVNLAGWPPDPSEPAIGDPEQHRRWGELLAEARAGALARPPAPAVAAAREAFTLAPQDPTTLFWYAKTMLAAGDPATARPAFLAARDRDPRVIRALAVFNDSIRALPPGRPGIAVVDLERAFADRSPGGAPGDDLFLDYVHPNTAGQRLAAAAVGAGILRVSGRGVPIERFVERVEADPGSFDDGGDRAAVGYALGMTWQQLGDLERAESAYRDALAGDPGFTDALVNLAGIRKLRGDRAEAWKLFEECLRVAPDSVPGLVNAGLFLLEEGKFEQGEELLRRALARSETQTGAHLGLADAAARRGAHEEAIGHLARAAELGHESAPMRRAWGAAALALGRREEAVLLWERALALDPADAGLRARLAEVKGGRP